MCTHLYHYHIMLKIVKVRVRGCAIRPYNHYALSYVSIRQLHAKFHPNYYASIFTKISQYAVKTTGNAGSLGLGLKCISAQLHNWRILVKMLAADCTVIWMAFRVLLSQRHVWVRKVIVRSSSTHTQVNFDYFPPYKVMVHVRAHGGRANYEPETRYYRKTLDNSAQNSQNSSTFRFHILLTFTRTLWLCGARVSREIVGEAQLISQNDRPGVFYLDYPRAGSPRLR